MLSLALAEHIARTRFEDLPPETVAVTKASIADALGVMLAASGLGEGCDAFVDVARSNAEHGRARVIGHGFATSPPMAAFANGAMAHAMDFEDTHDTAIAHPNAATVPAALAIAQDHRDQGGVGGRELITAVALGADLVCRLAYGFLENPDERGWHMTPLLGAFGAAAAAGKLLSLSSAQLLDAFSLVMCQATSSGELKYSPQSLVRAVRDAFMSKAGVLAALLAARGVKGFEQPFEGKAGFFALYAGGRYDAAAITRDLGRVFENAFVSFKPWPSCRGTHAYIEAALALKVAPRDVASMTAVISEKNRMLCEPAATKAAPRAAIDAKFSIPFTVAAALCQGRLTLDSFSAHNLADGEIRALAAKLRYTVDPSAGLREATRGSLTIETHDGRRLHQTIEQALGHPRNPLPPAMLHAKFLDCVAHARQPLDQRRADTLFEQVMALEKTKSIDALTSLL
jgi:2-methylcitrate dehydratase PrpD